MPAALMGRKVGMTRLYTEDGKNVPVTVIAAGPCTVTQVKTTERDGYSAVQLGFEDVKPARSTMPVIGHDAKAGAEPKHFHREFRMKDDAEAQAFELGQALDVNVFEGVKFIDVIGQSKGKGFQGPMKRHHFAGQEASHGVERKHRSSGSIGSHATDRGHGAKIKKGKRMAGHMGDDRVTERSLEVMKVDPAQNLLLVRGPVPGPNGGFVVLREAVRLSRRKQTVLKTGK